MGGSNSFSETRQFNILLVDDEPDIVRIAGFILKSSGFNVAAFTSPREALSCFMQNPDLWDMLITDTIMPELSGDDLVQECRRISSRLLILKMTGASDLIAAGFPILHKPFTPTALVESVHELIAQRNEQI